MSDYFGELSLCGDCIEDDSFHYATTSCEYAVNGVDAGQAICHAVNNHDRLVDALVDLTRDVISGSNAIPVSLVRAKELLKELGHEI